MSQFLKHYWINRDTFGWATDTFYGLMMPDIKGLNIVHRLHTENNIPFFLSTVPDYFEYQVTINLEQLVEWQNNPEVTIITSVEREVTIDIGGYGGEVGIGTTTVIVYDVEYQENYIIQQTVGEGLKIITQQEWDNEISSFDNRQQEKRYDILRGIRDKILELTDWIVIRAKEQDETLALDFKIWRQELRDLPNPVTFPTSFPTLPSELQNNADIQVLYDRFNEVRSIGMINDPLIP